MVQRKTLAWAVGHVLSDAVACDWRISEGGAISFCYVYGFGLIQTQNHMISCDFLGQSPPRCGKSFILTTKRQCTVRPSMVHQKTLEWAVGLVLSDAVVCDWRISEDHRSDSVMSMGLDSLRPKPCDFSWFSLVFTLDFTAHSLEPRAGKTSMHKVQTYKEYHHSVCPLVGIGTLFSPLSPASVPPPPPQPKGESHSPAGEGVGESQFRRLENRLSTLHTLCLDVSCGVKTCRYPKWIHYRRHQTMRSAISKTNKKIRENWKWK